MVATPKPLSAKDHALLTFIEQQYLLSGAVPTREVCEASGPTDGAHYRRCMSNADFRHAMAVRGITLRGLEGGPSGDTFLTEEQLVTANTMLDLRDNRSQTKKLRELGVSTAKWEGWLRDPAFQSYLRTRAEAMLPDNMHESHLALLDRVRSGDVNAIKYFNEITGRYNPNAHDKADVNAVLMMVLEVIQRHVTDPKQLVGISDDLIAIGKKANPNGFAGAIERDPRIGVVIIDAGEGSTGALEKTKGF